MAARSLSNFRYELRDSEPVILLGNKLQDRNVIAKPLVIQPGNRVRARLITGVNSLSDIKFIGELAFNVTPSEGVAIPHETFVTVESGIRQGLLAQKSIQLRSDVDSQRSVTVLKVRERLIDDWYEVLCTGGDIESQLLELINSDMSLARTLLRKDARDRIGKAINFKDKFSRNNPSATAARLSAAISRLIAQIECDVINQKAMRSRYLTCITITEQISNDIFDIQHLAAYPISIKGMQREVAKRLNRLSIKPYFWAVVWANNKFSLTDYNNPDVLMLIANVLLAEQTLGQIDSLLSAFKYSADKNEQRNLLRIITMTAATSADWPQDYQELGKYLRNFIRQNLSLSSSKKQEVYKAHAETLQDAIRNRSVLKGSVWFMPDTELLS